MTALDRTAIVRAALNLLDEVGLEGLSTRRLAAELGVRGPSLYWHFASMAELRAFMAEALLEEVMPAPDALPNDWRGWLAEGARGIRRAALSRRDGARVLAGARPTGESRTLSFPAMVGRLEREGFSSLEARRTLTALSRYALGWALGEQAQRRPPDAAEADFEFGLQAMLQGLAQGRAVPLRAAR
jgi:TetR/AcrR family tetracycline transcriptional repressor